MLAPNLLACTSVALAAASCILSLGCLGVAPRLPVAGEVSWSEASPSAGPDNDELLKVAAGDIVRFETTVPVRVGEVVESDEGVATTWRTLAPEDGSAMLRAGLFTTGVRATREVFRGAHTGSARRPEFAWFELEEDAVAWAESPLGTPFPRLAAATRFDPGSFAEIDLALGAAFPAGTNPRVAQEVTHAIRTLAALRAVNTLEGLRGFPYALNQDIDLPAAATPRVIDTRKYVMAEPGKPIPVTAEGPVELFVWARIARTHLDEAVEVRVTEGGHLRGATKGLVRREVDHGAPEGSELSQLRHVIIHVPPGEHVYAIEPVGAPAYVSAELSHPAARLEHAFSSTWREAPLLATAKRACEPASFGPACALALALAGEEGRPEFAQALAAANDSVRRASESVAQGGPGDYAAILESRAMAGDQEAAAIVANQVRDTLDQSMHDAWKRSTLRTTSWEPVTSGPLAPKWLTYLPRQGAKATCAEGGGLGARREVTTTLAAVPATPWRKARVLDLVAIAPCQGEPIRLEVDGHQLVAQPSGPRALWHIVVEGVTAKIRRLDTGPGHIYSMGDDECSTAVETTAGPERLDAPRTIGFPTDATAVGIEVWAVAGQATESLTIRSNDGRESMTVDVQPRAGLRGLDEQGHAWTRGARVPLPEWAKAGIRVEGPITVAARGIVRALHRTLSAQSVDIRYADPPNESLLLDLGRRVMTATDPGARGDLFAQRAMLLASYGAQVAALDDAASAASLGATVNGADPGAAVERAIRPMPRTAASVAERAFGLEPDFDTSSPRCSVAATSPRNEIAALDALLRSRPEDALFDRDLAARALRAVAASPNDPRTASIEQLALRGATWRLSHDVVGGAGRVPRPIVSTRDRVFDADGRLRPDVATGRPLGENFVAVNAEAPARAVLGQGPSPRIDVVAVAPRASTAACPFAYSLGDGPAEEVSLVPGKVTPVVLRPSPGTRKPILTLSMPENEADCSVLARVVFDRETPMTEKVADGWVLKTPHTQQRSLVTPAKPVRLAVARDDVLRIDARADAGADVTVIARVDGRELPVPADGEPVIVGVPGGSVVEVMSRSGEATVAIAERTAREGHSPKRPKAPPPAHDAPGRVALDLSTGGWRDTTRASPKPLSWWIDRLGTFEADTGVTAASLHEGSTTATGVDAYFYEDISYQRRIEAPNLYTVIGASLRLRDGAPTYAAEAGFYEDLDRYRLRITGTMTAFSQEAESLNVYSLQANGFVEYSGRVRPDFFILPRIGYDGFYTNLAKAPPSTVNIDDDVYDPFRYVRNTLVFLQALIWYCPHFNDIYYIRLRADYDVTNGQFSHASMLLPGILLIFHQAEISFFADTEYFAATPAATGTTTPVRPNAGVDENIGGQLIWHTVLLPGSFELRPNISAEVRANDLSWSISAGVNILAAVRRGQRDYSSLELSFPEETAGGVPWREESRVGP